PGWKRDERGKRPGRILDHPGERRRAEAVGRDVVVDEVPLAAGVRRQGGQELVDQLVTAAAQLDLRSRLEFFAPVTQPIVQMRLEERVIERDQVRLLVFGEE